jgi:hypothetical protein
MVMSRDLVGPAGPPHAVTKMDRNNGRKNKTFFIMCALLSFYNFNIGEKSRQVNTFAFTYNQACAM